MKALFNVLRRRFFRGFQRAVLLASINITRLTLKLMTDARMFALKATDATLSRALLNSMRIRVLLPRTAPPPPRLLLLYSLHCNALLAGPAFPPSSQPPPPSPAEDPPTAFVHLLKASSRTVTSLLDALLLHCRAIKTGLGQDDRVRTGLLNLYAKLGCPNLASKMFDEMLRRDVLAWTILISCYSRAGQYEEGLELFAEMLAEGTHPNCITLSSVLKCCVGFDDLRTGESVHGWIIRNEIELDVVLQNSILDFYVKCGSFTWANSVFHAMSEKNAVSWNIMIHAYLHSGDVHRSMELFRNSPYQDVSSWNTIINGQMEHGFHAVAFQILHEMVEKRYAFNKFSFSTALVLASRLAMLDLGKELHCQILRNGYEDDVFVRTALIDMYSKCGNVEASSCLFNGSSDLVDGSLSDSICRSAMVAGFVQNGMNEEALELLRKMFRQGVKVDQFSLTSVVVACSNAIILEQGKQVHCCVEKLGYACDVFLASAITDMYGKCGSLEDARKVFDNFLNRNVVLWSSLLGSYALHGQAAEAIQLFEAMLEDKIVPNEISFVHVLSACAHAGLVEKAHAYFKTMQEEHGIAPSPEHFACMVDLLGRAGLLTKAVDFINEKNISNHPLVLKALLSACRVHNNTEIASWVSEKIIQFEPCDSGHYVLLSNIYSSERKWEDASRVRSLMLERGVRRIPGQSWI